MPPSKRDRAGWISSKQLTLPRQTLQPEQVEPFLHYMFSDIAHRPKPLRLREAVAVARYLKALAAEVHSSQQPELEHLARTIELTVVQSGKSKMARKAAVVNFLREHSQTYLASFRVDRVVELVRSLSEPMPHEELFRPPHLMARRRSVSGAPSQILQDDLTERIFAAYRALRRTRVKNARGHIVTVLNRLAVPIRASRKTSPAWGPDEVYERVRQFHALWKSRTLDALKSRKPAQKVTSKRLKRAVRRMVDSIVDYWICGFRAMG